MTKPVIVNRATKASPLTLNEQDANFTNLQDATITLTAGTGGTAVVSDLNGVITLVAGTGITISGDNTAKTVTITNDSSGGDLIEDTTPQLGGNLDVNGRIIVNDNTSTAGGLTDDLILRVTGTGSSRAIRLEAPELFIGAGSSGGDGNAYISNVQSSNVRVNNNLTFGKDTVSISSGSFTPNPDLSMWWQLDLTGSFTLNLPSQAITSLVNSIYIIIKQDAVGSRTMAANSGYYFLGGEKTLSTAANAIDLLIIRGNNNLWLAELKKNYTA